MAKDVEVAGEKITWSGYANARADRWQKMAEQEDAEQVTKHAKNDEQTEMATQTFDM